MHYQANYEEVLTQMMGQITESMSAKGREKEHPVFHEAYINCDFCNVSDYRSLNR